MKNLCLIVPCCLLLLASTSSGAYLTPRLEEKLSTASPTEFIPVKIVMTEQANADNLARDVSALRGTARREAVIDRLKTLARDSQKGLLSSLAAHTAAGRAREIRPLWIVNCVACELTPSAVRDIVDMKTPDRIDLEETQIVLASRTKIEHTGYSLAPASDTAWGVKWINAPLVWDQGYQGQDVIIGELDTGVDYTHTDLAGRIWNNLGEIPDNGIDDDGNGYTDDYYGYNFNGNDKDPMDDQGHGTHVAGTICGDGTGGTLTGVAPQATVMALKVLDAMGGGQEADAWEAIQYACDNGANAMSLSIGWIHTVHNPDRPSWRTACENANLAGVTMCVASGNERTSGDPAPDNVRTPGDCPPPWLNPDQTLTGGLSAVVTVGATAYMNDAIATFSSFGPVSWENESPWLDYPYQPEMGLMDPDVCAPGTDVNSTMMGGGYSGDTWSGTSMATPHVSGAVALILSKNPFLTPAEVDQILETTALDLGPLGKDNDFGAGRIDAQAAITATPAPTGPHITIRTHIEYDTLDGDGDGNAEPGETIVMTVVLRNGGVDTAHATTTILTTADALVTVLDSTAAYGDILPGDTLAVNDGDPFVFHLDPSTPREHAVLFNLNISANSGGYTASRDLSVMTGEIREDDPAGPDAYGYYCYDVTDVQYTEVPTYEWRAIDSTQTALPGVSLDLGDDETATVPIPFTFRYYGVNYNSITISSDGWISPIPTTDSHHSNRCVPSIWGPAAMIAGLWDDLDPGNDGSPADIYYYYDGANYLFIIEFFEVEHYPVGDNELFQFVLYDPNFYPTATGDAEIEVHYFREPQQDDFTVAIENSSETIGLKYRCDASYGKGAAALTSSFAVKFTTDPPVLRPGVSEETTFGVNRVRPLKLNVKPNPFAGSTLFEVAGLVAGEEFSLSLYDVSGRLVRSINVDGGTSQTMFLWDGTADTGHKVAPGVYFARLNTKDQSVTRKAVLLR